MPKKKIKCPYCKKEMRSIINGMFGLTETHTCENEDCLFWGIERIKFNKNETK